MKDTQVILGKREIQKQQARERILEEALILFSERGLDKTTVADIVQQCEIARGTFYNYFPDMNALFDALIEQLNLQVVEAIQYTRKNTTNLYDYLHGTFKSYFNLISTEQMIQFHIVNQAYIRQSSYQSDLIKVIVKNLNRDLKSDINVKAFDEKYEFLLLSYMLVGAPPELFLATHTTDIDVSSEQLATFLAKLFHKVLME
ncbi:TetR/AcrR family transcriptional regulator [Flavobacteriaceae bacterium]|nr:TetR/AcrR family transcriptional regulator [Flavobacteriaceae bacterium]MDA9572148.1 TetR/AcrR family transcriptional regulator [Flavobacteriaceae bacterium]MDC3354173.1 TetR/AcrR family transcriptional regulator [Flavobacteriaceae bacterium]